MSANDDEPAGIYIHMPFCEKICPYCDFYSITTREDDIKLFVDSVISEIRQKSAFAKYEYDTIYFGGGTPSILKPDQIKKIIENLDAVFRFAGDVEVTVECNPSSLTKEKAAGYLESGVNRLSLGIQGFSNKNLKTLGRLHDSESAVESYRLSRNAGFINISLDLIYGLPGQTVEDWSADLKRAMELGPEHISTYNLIIEKNTEFGRLYGAGELELPPEEDQRNMYDLLCDILSRAGYRRYEISNFCRKGFESRHNLKYWTGKPYLGLGPSAVSFDGKQRIKNEANLSEYTENLKKGLEPPGDTEEIDREKAMEERIMMGLRLASGLSLVGLKNDFDYDLLKEKGATIQNLISQGLIDSDGETIRLTSKSLFISDAVMLQLI